MTYREQEKEKGIMAAAKDFVLFVGEKKCTNATRFSVTESARGAFSKKGILKLYDDKVKKYAIYWFVSGCKTIKNDEYLNSLYLIFCSYFSTKRHGKCKFVYEIINEIVRDLERKGKFAIAEKLKESANMLTIEQAKQIYC